MKDCKHSWNIAKHGCSWILTHYGIWVAFNCQTWLFMNIDTLWNLGGFQLPCMIVHECWHIMESGWLSIATHGCSWTLRNNGIWVAFNYHTWLFMNVDTQWNLGGFQLPHMIVHECWHIMESGWLSITTHGCSWMLRHNGIWVAFNYYKWLFMNIDTQWNLVGFELLHMIVHEYWHTMESGWLQITTHGCSWTLTHNGIWLAFNYHPWLFMNVDT